MSESNTKGRQMKPWDPCGLVRSSTPAFAVIILNQPIENVEGYNAVVETGAPHKLQQSPTHIVGDLDSIRDEVKRYYEEQGTAVLQDTDQYTTDLTKCLKFLHEARVDDTERASRLENTVLIGGLGGRADQAFAQIHQLYEAVEKPELECGNIYFLTPKSMIFLLEKGVNTISTPLPSCITENVGIIPIGKPAVITTKGLEWDVENWKTSFGTQVSTSNHIKASEVEITTSERFLFTMELVSSSE
ncbi:MAG: hypothetical protein Q9165_007133 [Trypethelium subeluteriae]